MWKIILFIVFFVLLCLIYDLADKAGLDPNLLMFILGIIFIIIVSKL